VFGSSDTDTDTTERDGSVSPDGESDGEADMSSTEEDGSSDMVTDGDTSTEDGDGTESEESELPDVSESERSSDKRSGP
jgi:hypothetical protein